MWRCDDLYSGFENLAGGEDSDQQIGGFEDLGLPIWAEDLLLWGKIKNKIFFPNA